MNPHLHHGRYPYLRPLKLKPAAHTNSEFLTIVREFEKKFQQISKTMPREDCQLFGQINGTSNEMSQGSSTTAYNHSAVKLKHWKDLHLSKEIDSILLERRAVSSDFETAVNDVKNMIKELDERLQSKISPMKFFEPSSHVVGSYAVKVAMKGSDIDFSIDDFLHDGPGMFRMRFYALKENLSSPFSLVKYELGLEYPVFTIRHRNGIQIDLTLHNEEARRNTQLLAWYSQTHPQFSELCQAVKCWATDAGIQNSKKGFFNSFSLCLLVIFYLQTSEIVPNIQKILPGTTGSIDVNGDAYYQRNVSRELKAKGIVAGKESLALLFYGFIKFYARFNFKTKWISIKRGAALDKKLDKRGRPLKGLPINHEFIVLEDPFMEEPFNCARAIRTDKSFRKIQEEFKQAEVILDKCHRFPFKKSDRRVKIEKEDTENGSRILDVIPVDYFTFDSWTKQMRSSSHVP